MSQNYNKSLNEETREWLLKVFAYADILSRTNLVPRNCPACGSSISVWALNNGYFDYVRCSNCSLLFMNPAPDPIVTDLGFKGDDENVMEYVQILNRYRKVSSEKPDPERDNKLFDIYRIKTSGRLLDVGCSFGEFLKKASHFYEVEGVEVNPFTAEIASQEFIVHRHYLQELDLGKRYDIVTLHQVMYGVPDPAGLFTEIHKILKDDGILYVNTPNSDSHAMRLYQGKSNHVYGYTSLNVFNKESLAALARRTGFQLRSFRTEWLDIYLTDLLVYLEKPTEFIHKKNIQVPNYEDYLRQEDVFQQSFCHELGEKGNYLVAILEKS